MSVASVHRKRRCGDVTDSLGRSIWFATLSTGRKETQRKFSIRIDTCIVPLTFSKHLLFSALEWYLLLPSLSLSRSARLFAFNFRMQRKMREILRIYPPSFRAFRESIRSYSLIKSSNQIIIARAKKQNILAEKSCAENRNRR